MSQAARALGRFGRAIRTCLIVWALTFAAVLSWTFLWPEPDLQSLEPADAILCLGAGMSVEGRLDPAAMRRVARCEELQEVGLAPIILFSGGVAAGGTVAAGDVMAELAVELEADPATLLSETRAQSTLQNMLFSLPMLDGADHLVVVTEAFHLPRSAASAYWAAWSLGQERPRLTLVMSERVRVAPGTDRPDLSVLFRESLAIWFNGARALAWNAGGLLGVADQTRVNWLR